MPDVSDAKGDLQDGRVGSAIRRLERHFEYHKEYAVQLVGFSLRAPRAEGEEFLLTLRGLGDDGGPVVAFHSAPYLPDVFTGAVNRLNNGTLKWKPDAWGR